MFCIATILTPNSCSCLCDNKTRIFNSDPVAKWLLDETYDDRMNNYDAVPSNNPIFTNDGYVNQAIFFNASRNQSLTAPHIPLAGSSFTIELWLKVTEYVNAIDHSILGLCPSAVNMHDCLHLTIRWADHRIYMGFFNDDCASNSSVPVNEWVHVAFVFDITTLIQTIYYNGIIDANCTASAGITPTTGSITIGSIPVMLGFKGLNFFNVSFVIGRETCFDNQLQFRVIWIIY